MPGELPDRSGPALLIVDDNEDNRYTLQRRLTREGYDRLAMAENGRVALEMLAADRFDLVLLDIMMPEMDGYQTLECIKSDMALRHIPVIMISALDEMDSVVRCIELGAEDYLAKPFNRTLLRARVRASLEKKRLRDQEAGHLDALEAARRRAEDLLHAMLPPGAVRELKATSQVRPRRYEDVAVLICDIVGFTPYCERTPPEQVVAQLQALVGAFEEVVHRHELEKIKTIGDAFMATAGLIHHVPDPVCASLAAGFEMIEAARVTEPNWEVRVGIHLGPVVAGVIGRRQYMFDLWGDTVNTAARLTGQATPGTVVMTEAVWRQVRGECRARSRGLVELKGKGSIELVECSPLPA